MWNSLIDTGDAGVHILQAYTQGSGHSDVCEVA
jgi:hypothetical protein